MIYNQMMLGIIGSELCKLWIGWLFQRLMIFIDEHQTWIICTSWLLSNFSGTFFWLWPNNIINANLLNWIQISLYQVLMR